MELLQSIKKMFQKFFIDMGNVHNIMMSKMKQATNLYIWSDQQVRVKKMCQYKSLQKPHSCQKQEECYV